MKDQVTLLVGLFGFVIVLALASLFVLFGFKIVRHIYQTLPQRYASAHWILRILWPRKPVVILTFFLFMLWGSIEISAFIGSTAVSRGFVTTIMTWPGMIYDWIKLIRHGTWSFYESAAVLVFFEIVFIFNFYLLALILYWLGRGVKKLVSAR